MLFNYTFQQLESYSRAEWQEARALLGRACLYGVGTEINRERAKDLLQLAKDKEGKETKVGYYVQGLCFMSGMDDGKSDSPPLSDGDSLPSPKNGRFG